MVFHSNLFNSFGFNSADNKTIKTPAFSPKPFSPKPLSTVSDFAKPFQQQYDTVDKGFGEKGYASSPGVNLVRSARLEPPGAFSRQGR